MLLLCYLHLFYGVGYNTPDNKLVFGLHLDRLVFRVLLVGGHHFALLRHRVGSVDSLFLGSERLRSRCNVFSLWL